MMRVCTIAIAIGLCSISSPVFSQTSQATSAPQSEDMSLDHGIRLLAGVRDHVFSFDDPGFYWFCRYVREDADDKAYDANAADVTPTRHLMERPGDFRGTFVQIEGRLLRKGAFEVPNRAGVGRLIQCEIGERGSRSVCTAVLTEDPGDIPVGSAVQVRGYFIKARSFQTTQGDSGSGPLVVSKRLSHVVASGVATPPETNSNQGLSGKWLLSGTALLFVAWIALRRFARLQNEASLHGIRRRPVAQTEGDFDWLTENKPAASNSTPDRDESP